MMKNKTSEEISRELDEALSGLPDYSYEGHAYIEQYGWKYFCLRILTVQRMGPMLGFKIGPLSAYVKWKW